MKQKTAKIAGIALALVFLSEGCAPDGKSGGDKYISEMKPGDVIVQVNGVDIRKADFDRLQHLNEVIYRFCKDIPLGEPNEEAERYSLFNEQRVPQLLIKMELMRQRAERMAVKPTEAEIEAKWAELAKVMKQQGVSLKEMVADLGDEDGPALRNLLEAQARDEAVLRAFTTNDAFTVSGQDLTNYMNNVKQFNANAEKLNREAVETLRKAKAEILNGGIFEDVAKKYSELRPEEGKEWKTLQLGELSDEEAGEPNPLKAWLKTAKPGDISDPMDLDDGISIVGYVGTWEGEPVKGMETPVYHQLVRCTRYARETAPVRTGADAISKLKEWKQKNAMQALGEELVKDLVLDYPHGTNLFQSAETRVSDFEKAHKNKKRKGSTK